jgi:hypothetical protein
LLGQARHRAEVFETVYRVILTSLEQENLVMINRSNSCVWLIGAAVTTISQAVSADVVTDWNAVTLSAIKVTSTNPPRASRVLAMVHCAMYDAINAMEDEPFEPFLAPPGSPKNGSEKAAAAAAAHRVLVAILPSQQAAFDAALAESVAGLPVGHKRKGMDWGIKCANFVLEVRANDGADVAVPYTPFSGPGFWQPTPPANVPALLPNWPQVTPFTMTSGSQFRLGPPPALDSAEYANDYYEVKELGSLTSATRTADQTEIAQFWADGGGTITPPGHWNVIAQTVATQHGNSVIENARLFAMLNCALADAAIACWDMKYTYNHWRPITAIRAADDSEWAPLIVTPPFPSYTSGHSTFSRAAATVLAGFFGRDDITFTTTSDGLPGVLRAFTSFSDAANEAGMSRIYGGIHWQYDNIVAQDMGLALAEHLMDHFFRVSGDVNADGEVTLADLQTVLESYGSCGGNDCPADLNHDGVVNGRDVLIVTRHMH